MTSWMYRWPRFIVVTSKTSGIMSIFYVPSPKQTDVFRIFQIAEIMEADVSFEIYRKGPSQCHNCHDFFLQRLGM